MNLTNIQDIRALMAVYNIAPRKKYGQNFLTDESVLDDIVEGSGVTAEDHVLEIGPGVGALTAKLAGAAGRVTAVEIDDGLIPLLRGTLADYSNVTVVHGDILKTDIRGLTDSKSGPLRVVANLPYYITTPVILYLMEYADVISHITVMIQKEVAERIQARPGSKEYGALSLAVQYRGKTGIIREVSPESFYPSPAVDSVVIDIELLPEPTVRVRDEELFFEIIRDTFNMRRKTLPNALKGKRPEFTRERIEQALAKMGKPDTVRGETFTLEEFALLSDLLGVTGDGSL